MSVDPREILQSLLDRQDLSQSDSAELLRIMASGALDPALAGALLMALRNKGEAADEIRGFAIAMRDLAKRPKLPVGRAYVDVVGTGGDGSHSLNLSTGSALLAAASGAQVVKHGNRSVSSKSGSADALAALGLPIPLDAARSAACLKALGFTFLFAPHYHPAMKHIAPVRQALGVRTIFNILGPLTNPAEPPYHVIGAFSEPVAELLAESLAGMPIERAFVIHGAAGWDEATPIGPFVCFDVSAGGFARTIRDPGDYGINRCTEADLRGADPAANSERLAEALCGRDTRPHRDALILGAALALEVCGRADDADSAISIARAALTDGSAADLLERLRRFGTDLGA